jgi:hypothetical protein
MTNSLIVFLLLSGLAPASAQQAEFDEIGPGFCQDASGGEGGLPGEDDAPTKEMGEVELSDAVCRARCGAVPWCLAFSDVGPGCVYYRVDITQSGGEAGGTCYKKKVKETTTSLSVQASFGAFTFIAILVSFIM